MDHLDKLRTEIDEIDEKILELIAERQKISIMVAQYKKDNNLDTYQNDRATNLLKKREISAIKKGISKEFTEELFRIIMGESIRIQELWRKRNV